ncbi:DJ-1/PfpI family protein [Gemmatimonas groenlandica]|uniref:DJ-1/PfpI family protein n=1 Tax=Gemmatimonas groenlandica TaxID=2732249 RepID=A0A6M4IW86_9BACT|nr:DJ-1/PfpI family protein [Gemmatimonas groenlandica]QJR37857.1 DJ-1/PfpI family protein [Gemmatimonas groenlandica]
MNSAWKPVDVGILLFDGVTQLDLTGPYEVFSRMPNTHVHLIAASLAPVRTEWGLRISPDTTLEDAPRLDLLCVPGGWGVDDCLEDERILGFLRARAVDARYVTSVCSGALLLGAAGLLRGYRATTHWMSLDLLASFGAEPVHDRVVRDRNRITGGGVTAGIDFALLVASELFGVSVAQSIQLAIEYCPDPPFDSGSPQHAPADIVRALLERSAGKLNRRRDTVARASARIP